MTMGQPPASEDRQQTRHDLDCLLERSVRLPRDPPMRPGEYVQRRDLSLPEAPLRAPVGTVGSDASTGGVGPRVRRSRQRAQAPGDRHKFRVAGRCPSEDVARGARDRHIAGAR